MIFQNSVIKKQFVPMSLNEVKTIEKYGHIIGMHGFNHENFGKLSPNEISKILIEGLRIPKKYNIKIEHFGISFL